MRAHVRTTPVACTAAPAQGDPRGAIGRAIGRAAGPHGQDG
ncbi:hypothetical protein [Streptomyces sp. NPDC059092]